MISLTITGTVKTAPTLQALNNEKQTPFCTFGIDFKDPNPKHTDVFFPLRVNFYGKGAEAVVAKGLAIGEPIVVMGRLITTVKDLPTGGKDKKASVEGYFLERLNEGTAPQQAPTQPQAQTPPVQTPPPAQPTVPPVQTQAQPTPALVDEDIPF